MKLATLIQLGFIVGALAAAIGQSTPIKSCEKKICEFRAEFNRNGQIQIGIVQK